MFVASTIIYVYDLWLQVFGHGGILKRIRVHDGTMDAQLKGVTVEHLLRHTGGWDETLAPIYDPMLNQLYLSRGHTVEDISKVMNTKGLPNTDDIIRYMLAKPLEYQPGTVVKHSNFGYAVLGRIIEEIMGQTYEYYVYQNILIQAGMWQTRIGPKDTKKSKLNDNIFLDLDYLDAALGRDEDSNMQQLFDIVPAQTLASSLGWYSNVHDVTRLLSTLFRLTHMPILREESIRKMLSRGEQFLQTGHEVWPAMGNIMVKQDGSLWYDNQDPSIGINLHFYWNYYQLSGDDARQDSLEKLELGESQECIVFAGISKKSHRDHLHQLEDLLLNPFLIEPLSFRNDYVIELGDDYFGGDDNKKFIMNYQLSEHRLEEYCNALRLAGYSPRWIHGYSYKDKSYFLLIFEKARRSMDLDFVIEKGTDKSKINEFINDYVTASSGYRISLVQTFNSASHSNKPCHLILLKRGSHEHLAEFGLDTDLKTYAATVQLGIQKGYHPRIQSVEAHHHEHHVTYLLERRHNEKSNFTMYHDLTLSELETVSRDESTKQFNLEYLDAYTEHGEPHFSAIFFQGTYRSWLLQTEVDYSRVSAETLMWSGLHYQPITMIAYMKGDELKFASLWETT